MTDLFRAEVREALAAYIEPGYERPCDCDSCDCQNFGDAQNVAIWDALKGAASGIRACDLSQYKVTVPEDDEELLETLREEAELHCVSIGQGFEQSYVTEERALMHLLVRAANRIESLAAQVAERDRQILGYQKECHAVEMELGKALGYPRFCDDQKNFPGATEESGCCIGEHTPASIAMEAAERLAEYERRIAELGGKNG